MAAKKHAAPVAGGVTQNVLLEGVFWRVLLATGAPNGKPRARKTYRVAYEKAGAGHLWTATAEFSRGVSCVARAPTLSQAEGSVRTALREYLGDDAAAEAAEFIRNTDRAPKPNRGDLLTAFGELVGLPLGTSHEEFDVKDAFDRFSQFASYAYDEISAARGELVVQGVTLSQADVRAANRRLLLVHEEQRKRCLVLNAIETAAMARAQDRENEWRVKELISAHQLRCCIAPADPAFERLPLDFIDKQLARMNEASKSQRSWRGGVGRVLVSPKSVAAALSIACRAFRDSPNAHVATAYKTAELAVVQRYSKAEAQVMGKKKKK